MKKLVKVEEIEGEGLLALLGKEVILFCSNYFYAGTLEGVNETCVLLSNAHAVFDTGSYSEPGYKDAQSLHIETFYVQTQAIESFGERKIKAG